MVTFIDRLGNREQLVPVSGERVESLLLRHRIPPASVITLRNGKVVADNYQIDSEATYEIFLIEGYDIARIRQAYIDLTDDEELTEPASYLKRLFTFSKSGALDSSRVALSLDDVVDYVDTTVTETCKTFNLINEGDGILVGLSGGVDSSSLLLALAAARDRLPSFRLVAVTFEDFDSKTSPTFHHASQIAQTLKVEHHLAPADLARDIFHLNAPLREVLPTLMKTNAAHFVMYIDHHTTRRTLEVFAEQHNLASIALGLHTTDLIAGLMNGWMTGYNIANLPKRQIGNTSYIYPLAFIQKRELHLYHLARTGDLARHASPNTWERNPMDRNFYYYLSDLLQAWWPGLETMLFTAHNWRISRQPPLRYEQCRNCGSTLVHQPFTSIQSDECDACAVMRENGFID